MGNSINISLRTDSDLKNKAEIILKQFGMTLNGSINMFLTQIVRECSIPLNLSLNKTANSLYTDLLLAEEERKNGIIGESSDNVLTKIDEIIKNEEIRNKNSQ